jgi:hypothetical protein
MDGLDIIRAEVKKAMADVEENVAEKIYQKLDAQATAAWEHLESRITALENAATKPVTVVTPSPAPQPTENRG